VKIASPLVSIDPAQAQVVAEAFSDAPQLSPHQIVRAAYADLAHQANRWFAHITGQRVTTPIRVVHTRVAEPYASGEELSARVRADGVLELCPAHYDRDRRHPLLDTSIGGTYDRLRAVHDVLSHAVHGFGFDRNGEYSAWLVEDRMYTGLARWALATELHAEHSVLWTTGSYAEHKATLLPRDVVQASRRRVTRSGTARSYQPEPVHQKEQP
jgi:hypothetical protein